VDGEAELVVLHLGARDGRHLRRKQVVDLRDHRQELARRLAQHRLVPGILFPSTVKRPQKSVSFVSCRVVVSDKLQLDEGRKIHHVSCLVACNFARSNIYIFVWEKKKERKCFYLAVVAGVGGGPSDVHPVAPGVVQLRQPHEAEHLHTQHTQHVVVSVSDIGITIHQRVLSINGANGSGRGKKGRKNERMGRSGPEAEEMYLVPAPAAHDRRWEARRHAAHRVPHLHGRDTEEDVKQNNSL
jgi:hypothetical protein